jgi:hypothetical protein
MPAAASSTAMGSNQQVAAWGSVTHLTFELPALKRPFDSKTL